MTLARAHHPAGGRPGVAGRIIDCGTAYKIHSGFFSSGDQYLSIGQQGGGMVSTDLPEPGGAGGRPYVTGGVVEFAASLAISPVDKDIAAGQQSRRVVSPCRVEIAGGRPAVGGRIVEFSASGPMRSSCDQDIPGEQQGRGMLRTRLRHSARRRPGPAGRIVEFSGTVVVSACD